MLNFGVKVFFTFISEKWPLSEIGARVFACAAIVSIDCAGAVSALAFFAFLRFFKNPGMAKLNFFSWLFFNLKSISSSSVKFVSTFSFKISLLQKLRFLTTHQVGIFEQTFLLIK